MALTDLPQSIIDSFEIFEWKHGVSILKNEFPDEFSELVSCLSTIQLTKKDILSKGGRKSVIAEKIDTVLYKFGWEEAWFETSVEINGVKTETPTHGVDCYKNRIALEVEWNNKTEFYDRDLNNFRLLFDRGAISVGIIITRSSHLQYLFNILGKGSSYGSSSTHMDKVVPRILGGSAGGCPLIIFGLTVELYEDTTISASIRNDMLLAHQKAIQVADEKKRKEQAKIDRAALKQAKLQAKEREQEIKEAIKKGQEMAYASRRKATSTRK